MYRVKFLSLALLPTLFACSDSHDSPVAIEPAPGRSPQGVNPIEGVIPEHINETARSAVDAGFLLPADAELITAWAPQQWRSQVPEGI